MNRYFLLLVGLLGMHCSKGMCEDVFTVDDLTNAIVKQDKGKVEEIINKQPELVNCIIGNSEQKRGTPLHVMLVGRNFPLIRLALVRQAITMSDIFKIYNPKNMQLPENYKEEFYEWLIAGDIDFTVWLITKYPELKDMVLAIVQRKNGQSYAKLMNLLNNQDKLLALYEWSYEGYGSAQLQSVFDVFDNTSYIHPCLTSIIAGYLPDEKTQQKKYEKGLEERLHMNLEDNNLLLPVLIPMIMAYLVQQDTK